MATKPAIKETSKGICIFCKGEFDKGKMTQHLKYCKQRAAIIKAENAAEEQKIRLFHLLVEGRYLPQYWMHLEMPASATLADLDSFLRDTWLECCGHLSEFTINRVSYPSQSEEEMYWDFGNLGNEEAQDGEDETNVDDEDELDDEDKFDISDSELAGLQTSKIAKKLIDLISSELHVNLADLPPAEAQAKFTDLLSRKLQSELGAPVPPELQSQLDLIANFMQPSFLQELASGAYDEHDMEVELGKVLKVGQKFYHTYDFGSSTELALKVVAEREGVEEKDEDGDPLDVLLMASNEPPVIPCRVCGKPATKIASGYYYAQEGAMCDECAKNPVNLREYEDEYSFLPVVNSPRVGVCGYTGSGGEWEEVEEEWDEEDDDEEDEEE